MRQKQKALAPYILRVPADQIPKTVVELLALILAFEKAKGWR